MEVSREILNDIADSMEVGLKCFIHRKTLEVVCYMDEDRFPDMDPEDWEDQINKVEEDSENFIEIEKRDSREGFEVMAEFAESLPDSQTKIRLITALEGHKPFGNFKHQIENAGEYKQMWFAFKREKDIEWVRDQLNRE